MVLGAACLKIIDGCVIVRLSKRWSNITWLETLPAPHGDLAAVVPLSILASIPKDRLEKLFLVKDITLS